MEIDAEIGSLLDRRYKSLIREISEFVVAINPELKAKQSHEVLTQFDIQLPNIVNVFDRLLDTGGCDDQLVCIQLISALVYLERYFTIRGLWEIKLRWVTALLKPSFTAAPTMTHILFNVMGTAHSEMGNYEKAVDLYQLAIQHANLVDKPDLSRIYGNLGVACWRLGRLDEALVYMRRLWRAEKEAGNFHETALALANLAEIHLEYGDGEGGLLAALDALKLASKIGDTILQAQLTALVAKHMTAQRLLYEALPVYKTAIKLLDELEDQPVLGLTLFNYGMLQHCLQQNISAIDLIQFSLEIFEHYGMAEEIRDAQSMLKKLQI